MSTALRGSEREPVTDTPASRCRIADIAPADARDMLIRHGPGLRRDEGRVQAYADLMNAGAWQFNGMPLIISRGGLLLDGAQRLFACLDSGTPFSTLVADGIDGRVEHTIDQHRRRSISPRADAAVAIRSEHGPIECGKEIIDSTEAAAILARGGADRPVSKGHVAALARDLAQGRWMFNAQPICFGTGGTLLNGRHRLEAVVLSGRRIEAVVVRGLADAARTTYDTQPRRGAVLGTTDEIFGDRALAHAMANLLWHHECRDAGTASAKATAAEIYQIIAQHPGLLRTRGFARRMAPFGRASVLGYAAYVMERQDTGLARRFLTALETGADMRPSHPILALRGRMQVLRANKAPAETQLAALLDAWHRFRARPAAARRI